MTKNRLSKPLKKKVIILTSVFLALIAGLSTSALWLNSRHEQKVLSAAKQTYTGNEIIQTDSEITSDDIGTDNIVLTSVAGNQTNDEANNSVATKNVYLADISKANDKEKKKFNEYISKNKIVANNEIVFNVASPDDNQPADQSVNQIDLQGKTLRQYADEQGKKLVAVIDTGVNGDYSIQSVNFSNSDSLADKQGHGTIVAKKIMETSNNQAMIVSLKAMDDDGTGTMFNVMQAIQYATEQHVDIINLSIAAPDNGDTDIFKSVVKTAIKQGITVVAAAGNYGLKAEHFIPANIDGVIAVGSVDSAGEVEEFSDYGLKDQVYVKNTTSTSLATAEVTGTLANEGTVDKSDNITKDYHLSPTQKVDEIFNKNDQTKFNVETTPDYNYSNQKVTFSVSGKGTMNVNTTSWQSTTTSFVWTRNSQDTTHTTGFTPSDFSFSASTGYHFSHLNWSGLAPSPVLYHHNGSDADWHAYTYGDRNYYSSNGTTLNPLAGESTLTNVGDYQWYAGWILGTDTKATAYFEPNSYTITFYSNGGYFPDGTTVQSGSNLIYDRDNYSAGDASRIPTRTGYTLDGYYTSPSGGTKLFDANNNAIETSGYWQRSGNSLLYKHDGDLTVYAHWTAINYTVSFKKGTIDKYYDTNWYYGPTGQWDYNDVQTMPGSKTVIYQEPFTLPTSSEATAKGYNLYKWKDDAGNPYNPGQSVTAPANNMSFTAVWSQKDDHTVKITTNVNDKESADLTNPVNGEQIYSITATTQRINRENVGSSESWTSGSNNQGRGSDNLITFNRSTLRQGYTNQDGQTYDFYEDGRWNSKKGTDATSANKTEDFGKDGQPTITARVSHEANSSQELVMYVRGNTYNVIFDPNDMTGAAKDGFVTPSDPQFVRHEGPATVTRSFTYGKNETIPDNLGISWSGHKLVGWSTSPNPYKDSNAITYLVNTNNNDRTSWYFGYIGGYTNNGTTKNTTSSINASFAPSSDGVVPDNASQIVTKDHAIVLYAVWERNNVNITIDPNNGTWDGNGRKTNRTIKWGDNILLGSQQNGMVTPPDNAVSVTYNPEEGTVDRTSDTSNYEFDHWLILDTASQKEAKDLDHGFIRTGTESKSVDGTNQYFAGAQATTLQAKYYYTIITLPLPVREGYTFLGWYYDDAYMEAAGKAGDEYRIPARKAREYNNHVTLYARWIKNDYQYGDTIDSRMENLNSPNHEPETYKFAIGKTNRNGTPLDGAVIEISQAKYVNDQPSFDPDNVVLTMDESKGGLIDRSGKVLVSTKNAGMYTYETKNKNDIPLTENTIYVARETKAPQGYFTADDYVFTYTGYDTINIRDDKISTNLSLIKNSIYPGQTIENAQFELYDLTTDPNKQHVLALAESDRQGKIQLIPRYKTPDKQYLTDYITAGDQMLLHEFNAPVNFQVQDFKFTIPKQKQKIKNLPFEYVPDAKQALILDNPAYINLKVTKLDGQDKTKKLPNVTFQLFVMKDGALYPAVRNRRNNQLLDPYKNAEEYQKNKDNIITATTGSIPGTNDYGVATFTNLSPKALATGSTDTERDQYIAEIDDNGKESDWYLKEIKNPNKGYNLLSKPMILRISENEVRERREAGEITPTFYFNVYNGKVIETLNAGGNGTLSYILIGTVLIIVGAVYLRKKKKLPA